MLYLVSTLILVNLIALVMTQTAQHKLNQILLRSLKRYERRLDRHLESIQAIDANATKTSLELEAMRQALGLVLTQKDEQLMLCQRIHDYLGLR